MTLNKKNNITALVPVKGNSQRVKKKNLRKFHNSNLLEVKLKQLKKTNCFSKIIISSEDTKVLEIAKKHNFEVHKRIPYYSTSKVPMSEVYSHIASEIEGENIAWVNLTNPLAGPEIYNEAVKRYIKLKNKFDCLLSAVKTKQNFFYKNKPINFKPYPWPRSQDLKPLVSLSFIISILKRKTMIKLGSCVGKKPHFFYVNPIISLDIDDIYSFKLSEAVFKNNNLGITKKQFFEY